MVSLLKQIIAGAILLVATPIYSQIYTPFGSRIYNTETKTGTFSEAEKADHRKSILETYPGTEILDESTWHTTVMPTHGIWSKEEVLSGCMIRIIIQWMVVI